MRFLVPQFIEVEDKIFGPLTFKQFAYLLGGVGWCVILYVLLGFIPAAILGLPVLGLGVALAFFKVNSRPFIFMMESAFNFFIRSRLYIWKKEAKKKAEQEKPDEELADANRSFVPKLSGSKLKDLAWSLDIKESMYENEEQARQTAPQAAKKNAAGGFMIQS
jgi:hypothetical protein